MNIQMKEIDREGFVGASLCPRDKAIKKFEVEMRVRSGMQEDSLLREMVVVVDDVIQVGCHFLSVVNSIDASCLVEPIAPSREQRGVIQESNASGTFEVAVEETIFLGAQPLAGLGERETARALVIDRHSGLL
jgi:hypothetical protein